MFRVGIEDASDQLPELIEAAIRGEQVVISRDHNDGVKLVPVRQRTPGALKGRIRVSDHFDDPLPDFEPYSP